MLEKYDIEVDKIVEEAKKIDAKNIVLQLPDGLKADALKITSEIEQKTGATVILWAGSNFGACDVPAGLPKEYDLLVAVGHAIAYNKKD
jgi:diphthamide biosynthesis enzyme Dph1/Dph2-like protein|tara:strand:- start:94 stop:360 length:267 start_codon:yes stop_codon:yes gene_type:complete